MYDLWDLFLYLNGETTDWYNLKKEVIFMLLDQISKCNCSPVIMNESHLSHRLKFLFNIPLLQKDEWIRILKIWLKKYLCYVDRGQGRLELIEKIIIEKIISVDFMLKTVVTILTACSIRGYW